MNIARVSSLALRKTRSGGARSFGLPSDWITTSYGSGWPIRPVTVPRDTQLPRTIDYPISVNSTLTPRTGWGLMSFASLKEVYENVTEVKMPVNLIWRELTSFDPRLVDNEGNEVQDHPLNWMTKSPDRNVPFAVWMTRLIKCMKVYDAPAVFLEKDSSGICGLHYIDGSTLFLIIDEYGNLPKPETIEAYGRRMLSRQTSSHVPSLAASKADDTASGVTDAPVPGPSSLFEWKTKLEAMIRDGKPLPDKVPAFTQIIKGTPYSWWSADDIWYMPQSRRMDSPYGESFIEQAWAWIMVMVNITAFELGHYKTGTMPEGFVTLPMNMFPTLDKINVMEQAFDARMSANSPVERSRLRMFPEGSNFIPTKKPDFPGVLYKQAWHNILHTIGIPPAEFGDIPGAGLGGAGFKEGSATDLSRNTLNPHRRFVSGMFNYVLEKVGEKEVFFDLGYPLEQIDPEKQRQTCYDGMMHGTLTLNDALGELGLDPVTDSMDDEGVPLPDHVANKHLIVAGSSIYVIEDMVVNETGLVIPNLSPQDANQFGGVPIGPETVVAQDGNEHTPEDNKTLQAAIQNIRENGQLDSKTISIPNTVKPKVDVSKFDPEQVNVGIEEESKEHPGFDAEQIKQIVYDHLREEPAYYSKAAKPPFAPAEFKGIDAYMLKTEGKRLEKHCGVCPDDDDYYQAPISREIDFSFPDPAHANEVDIVAMIPEGLAAKPALFKPLGGELPELQEMIGGSQMVREEAAYLLDRSLMLYFVPVAYVVDEDEQGAVVFYSMGAGEPFTNPADYDPQWIERAAVLDYILGQQDRGHKHNFLGHPDDPKRPLLIDNGLTFPVNPNVVVSSPFVDLMVGQLLSDDVCALVRQCLADNATWKDIGNLVGVEATNGARERAAELLAERAIPGPSVPAGLLVAPQ